MVSVSEILFVLAVVCIVYWWIKKKRFEAKLNWIPTAPGHPIFGNTIELGDPIDTLNVMKTYLKGSNGLCVLELLEAKVVLVNDVKFLEFLLTSMQILDKSQEYQYLYRWLGDGILTTGGLRWKKSRKLITPAFHFSILGEFIPIFESNSEVLIDLLKKQVGKDSVDIYNFATMCTLDIICESSMGVKINAQLYPKSEYVNAARKMCRIMARRSLSPLKRSDLLYQLTKEFYDELKYIKILHSHTNKVIRTRKEELKPKQEEEKKEKSPNDETGAKKKFAFLDILLQAKVDGEPLPDHYIREEVDTLMFEGHDTTASSISFTILCLADNPEVQAKAFEEQYTIFRDDPQRAITYQDIQGMRYLELVIKESLRMYPPAPLIARRVNTDTVYEEGKVLPKGTTILMNIHALHHNPKYYPDPEIFDPLRFEKTIQNFAYIPFSAGPRNCIGQKFAIQEMKIVLSKILRNFEILTTVPRHKPILAAEQILKSSNGLLVRLAKRQWHQHSSC